MLKSRSLVLATITTIVLMVSLQTRFGNATVPIPGNPPGFVAVTGPHGITVLVGPLGRTPTGGYQREVILPGQAPFMVNTEPGVTPQEIANTYG